MKARVTEHCEHLSNKPTWLEAVIFNLLSKSIMNKFLVSLCGWLDQMCTYENTLIGGGGALQVCFPTSIWTFCLNNIFSCGRDPDMDLSSRSCKSWIKIYIYCHFRMKFSKRLL